MDNPTKSINHITPRISHAKLSSSLPKKYDSLMWLGLAIMSLLGGFVTWMLPFVFVAAVASVVLCVAMGFYSAIRERQVILLALNLLFVALLVYGVYVIHSFTGMNLD